MSALMKYRGSLLCLAASLSMIVAALATADPCGMVPPIYTGESPITRSGLQQTYVFYHDGVESFAIRPGYEGDIDNFGMLIPFPTPPSIRKVHDSIFDQIKNAIDPPEVVIDLRPPPPMARAAPGGGGFGGGGMQLQMLSEDEVRVLREEAVGMYEVAVLAAGSAEALKKWMDENGYQFPNGMDDVANEYITDGWCFAAVKTKVSARDAIEPRPGQREANPGMPAGSSFEGHVQGLAFRFRTDELVVPMRLSAFNEGDTRNVVYLLTDAGKRIRNIPEEYVRRQITGNQLVSNITEPLPLRVFGGTIEEIPERRMQALAEQRDPEPENGIAAQMFVSDLLASQLDAGEELLLDLESSEKDLVLINERLELRGAEVDNLIVDAMSTRFEKDEAALEQLRSMTLTVVDGDFPRAILASQNLRFDNFRMAAQLNTPMRYNTRTHQPGNDPGGRLYLGALERTPTDSAISSAPTGDMTNRSSIAAVSLPGAALLFAFCLFRFNRESKEQ
ncbi:MAG: DUF2330 domain-containing protein [Planctomycetota bacterium]